MMAAGEHPETRRKPVLVNAIVVSEKRIGDTNALLGYLALAFPEHSDVVSSHKVTFRDVNLEIINELTYEQWFSREHQDMLMRGIQSLEKGTHILPRREEIEERTESHYMGKGSLPMDLVLQRMMLDLTERMWPLSAASTSSIRKWSVIDGPEVKEGFFGKPRPSRILVVGVCSV